MKNNKVNLKLHNHWSTIRWLWQNSLTLPRCGSALAGQLSLSMAEGTRTSVHSETLCWAILLAPIHTLVYIYISQLTLIFYILTSMVVQLQINFVILHRLSWKTRLKLTEILQKSLKMIQYQHVRSRSKHKHQSSNSMPRNNVSISGRDSDGSDNYKLTSYKTQRLPRSADPSPQRTVERIESLGEKHGGI